MKIIRLQLNLLDWLAISAMAIVLALVMSHLVTEFGPTAILYIGFIVAIPVYIKYLVVGG